MGDANQLMAHYYCYVERGHGRLGGGNGADGPSVTLGTAVIPIAHSAEDGAKALLMFRRKPSGGDQKSFQEKLLADARDLHARIAAHHH